MHGLGNDFVVIDGINQSVNLSAAQLQFLADRHFGVGCDQILLVERPVSKNADFRYRIFNADGGEVSQCGNGARCFAKFVRDRKLTHKREIRVDTHAGQLVLLFDSPDSVRVNMGVPLHNPEQIPLQKDACSKVYTLSINNRDYSFGAVSLGNPHAVIQVDDIDQAPVRETGPLIESHSLFPERVNVGFMQILDHGHIKLRVFERGSGETLACGSGACAAAVIGIEWNKLESPVRVDLRGGVLMIRWEGRKHPVYMSGPAASVFEGKIQI
ncbi:MAG: diaminopimelate epimerase [Methylococcales bacterium]